MSRERDQPGTRVFVLRMLVCVLCRTAIKDDIAQIKREEGFAMHTSRNHVARASGVSINDRQANASRLRAKLAEAQAKFLRDNGNDQVWSPNPLLLLVAEVLLLFFGETKHKFTGCRSCLCIWNT